MNNIKLLLLSCARIAEMLILLLLFRKQEGKFLKICKQETKITIIFILASPLFFLGAIAIALEYAYVLKHWRK